MRIAVDIMGSGHHSSLILPVLKHVALDLEDGENMIIIATPEVLAELQFHLKSFSNISFLQAKDAIAMDDDPLQVVRSKKESSMALAIKSLKEGAADAVVTMGNTGALTAYATLTLPKLPHIERPALVAKIPTEKGELCLLDVGANVRCSRELLLQNAILGAMYVKALHGKLLPKVGLLNIGGEAGKGKEELCEAYKNLRRYPQYFDFAGNVEGHEIFSVDADVIVTDGFTGNVVLKTAEGLSAYIFGKLQEKGVSGIHELKQKLHYAEAPGAILCGVEGIVIKCHGERDPHAFYNGIVGARDAIKACVIPKMKDLMHALPCNL